MNFNKNNDYIKKVISDKSKNYQRYHLNKERAYYKSDKKIAYKSSIVYPNIERESNTKSVNLSKKQKNKNINTPEKKID